MQSSHAELKLLQMQLRAPEEEWMAVLIPFFSLFLGEILWQGLCERGRGFACARVTNTLLRQHLLRCALQWCGDGRY